MGSCVSVHKDPDSAMRFRLGATSSSKEKKLFALPLPAKDGAQNGGSPVAAAGGFGLNRKPVDSEQQGYKGHDYGSKEETFFDTRAWLDSDCEDDFFSVNGDFTPSGGCTPNNQFSIPKTPRLSKTLIETFPDAKSEPSPRKKLADFLLETLASEAAANGQAIDGKVEDNGRSEFPATGTEQPPKSSNATPHLSGTNSVVSSERTPNGDIENGKEKPMKTMHCCLPGVVPSFSIYDKKKQRLSPELRNGGG